MDVSWQIQLFGGLRAERGDRVLSRFSTYKTGALFAYLALYKHRAHPREALQELFWPDDIPEAGRNGLRVALSSLRRQLEPPGAGGGVLLTDRSKVQLSPDAADTDVRAFEAFLQSASRQENPDARRALLVQAAELYQGDLLPEIYEDWAGAERERLSQAYLSLLQSLGLLLGEAGHWEEAAEYAYRAVQADPFSEEAHRRLMRVQLAQGRPDAARRQFQTLERLLRDELGLIPEAETQALAASLKKTLLSPISTRTKSVPRTDHAGGTYIRPAGTTPAAPDTLPRPLTRFFGRQAEQAALTQMRGEARLLTITGSGGVGKTRLAIETARLWRADFPGVVCFAPLADLRDPHGLPDTLARALRIPPSPQADAWAQVTAMLARHPSLLVLDNFEQIADGGAPIVQALLTHAPTLICLVTSRRRLDLPGECELPLSPLPVPDGLETAEQLGENDAARLFLDRARAVRPDFAVSDRNAPDLAALCRQLEGIPLALELAAARVRALSLTQMCLRLDQRFEFLTSRRTDKESRHRSLWAALSWSYDLLPPDLQRFFVRLSVFQGGWDLEAAEMVCEERSALDFLGQLRGHSLVISEDAIPDLRFRLLETIREFAVGTDRRGRSAGAVAPSCRLLSQSGSPGGAASCRAGSGALDRAASGRWRQSARRAGVLSGRPAGRREG